MVQAAATEVELTVQMAFDSVTKHIPREQLPITFFDRGVTSKVLELDVHMAYVGFGEFDL